MTTWIPSLPRDPTILLIGAHADDIEIGCGGTILELVAQLPRVRLVWIVCSGNDIRRAEAAASATAFAQGAAQLDLEIHRFRDGFFPYDGGPVKEMFEQLKGRIQPDLVFTHSRDDRHQDHRVVSDLTWNTFRGPCVLEYEIPKFDGDLGHPNCFVPLAAETLAKKAKLLDEHFESQRVKSWFSEETFRAVARIRGIESATPSGYAEGFFARKMMTRLTSSDRHPVISPRSPGHESETA